MEFRHVPVLLHECLDNLNIFDEGVYVDCTVGGGGHSLKILERLPKGRLVCIDQDYEAIKASKKRLEKYKDQVRFIHSNFENLKDILTAIHVNKVNGILVDLGVSSYQIDNPDRGFSYIKNTRLDMRMDTTRDITAEEIINEYPEEALVQILRDYGEEKYAKKIVKTLIKERPIFTTHELVNIIEKSVPKCYLHAHSHPAKKTFQAIRIELNRELDVIKNTIEDMVDCLQDGGRLCIITFHSLEDRIVKHAFKRLENPCECPSNFPKCMCGKKSKGKVITRKPILPSEFESDFNPRSRSAKLRVFVRRYDESEKL